MENVKVRPLFMCSHEVHYQESISNLKEGKAVYIIQKLQKSDKYTSKVPFFMPSCFPSFVSNHLFLDKKLT